MHETPVGRQRVPAEWQETKKRQLGEREMTFSQGTTLRCALDVKRGAKRIDERCLTVIETQRKFGALMGVQQGSEAGGSTERA